MRRMARPRKPKDEKKIAMHLRLDPGLYAWLQENVGVGKPFATMTHAIETGLVRLRDGEFSPGRSRSSTSKK